MNKSLYLTHVGYWEVEEIFNEGRIDRATADEAHKQHKIISEARIRVRDAEDEMMEAITVLHSLKVKPCLK